MNGKLHKLESESRLLLREQSERAQQLRLSLLRDANILIVGGGGVHNLFIYLRMLQLGVNVHLTDLPSSPWSRALPSGTIASFIPFDFSNSKYIGERFAETLQDHGFPSSFFDAVITFDEMFALSTPIIAQELDVPAQNISSVTAARNKAVMRQTIERAGIPSALFKVVQSNAEVEEACEFLGFPIIVKPCTGVRSVGVQEAHTVNDALKAFEHSQNKMDDFSENTSEVQEVVMEEFLSGVEVDVDILMSGGDVVYAKVVDNWPSVAPWFEERGFYCPSELDGHMQKDVLSYSKRCIAALDFQNGLFQVKCRLTDCGARLVGINVRLGCESTYRLHRETWGVDLIMEQCLIAMGVPSRPMMSEHPLCECAAACFSSPYSGIVDCDDWLELVGEFEQQVVSYSMFYRKGDAIIGWDRGVPDNIGVVFLRGSSRGEMHRMIQELFERLEVPVRPNTGLRVLRFRLEM